MKRINKALLVIATSLFLMGCNSNNDNPSTSETPSLDFTKYGIVIALPTLAISLAILSVIL